MKQLTMQATGLFTGDGSIYKGDYADYLAKTKADIVPRDFFSPSLNGFIEAQFPNLFFKGDLALLQKPCVSIVGTRNPTPEGRMRARRVAAILAELNFVVVSGLAKGIDTVAHMTAIERKAGTIAILGTPMHKIYPAENKALAAEIANTGLLLSPALPDEEKGRYLFPRRNRLMALLSQATIVIEAGETSGVVHQAAECLKLGRKLLLLKSLVENKDLSWPAKFVESGAQVIETPEGLKCLLAQD